MTPKQRKDRLIEINKLLTSMLQEPDRFGHYKVNGYRFKMQKTSVRLEKKVGSRWMRIKSWYHKDITDKVLEDHILRVKLC